jgi:hypothetical protein
MTAIGRPRRFRSSDEWPLRRNPVVAAPSGEGPFTPNLRTLPAFGPKRSADQVPRSSPGGIREPLRSVAVFTGGLRP